jgi:hypothetical protein
MLLFPDRIIDLLPESSGGISLNTLRTELRWSFGFEEDKVDFNVPLCPGKLL